MRIGIIGAGQLGQMLGFAAHDLGHECVFLDPAGAPPARVAGPVVRAAFGDRSALAALAARCDVVTYEFENVPVAALSEIADRVPVYPPLAALENAQDRLSEKRLFDELAIPVPDYRPIDAKPALEAAAAELGYPLFVKTRRMGYDGKGQYVVREPADVDAAWEKLGAKPLLAECSVAFDCEVSTIGVRSVDGSVATYCLTRNEHVGGILHISRAPVDNPALTELASTYVRRLLDRLDYVGVLTLELFVVGETLLANEFAPRVHNSGHWTIEGAATSQFANHLHAIANEAPGPTRNLGHSGMLNLIGAIPPSARELAAGTLHDYGKSPRPGRKLGHITITAGNAADRDRLLADIVHSVTESTSESVTGTWREG